MTQIKLLGDPEAFKLHISQELYTKDRQKLFFSKPLRKNLKPSAVLVLLGKKYTNTNSYEPCLILNKRSQNVRQPGDLCCPGGGIKPRFDPLLSQVLGLPGVYMSDYHFQWQQQNPRQARRLRLLLAAGLREGFEEMRLNPFRFQFLGPLPTECMRIFKRIIYPLVGWVARQRQFVTNGEVEKVVHIPLRMLLLPDHYACYRVEYGPNLEKKLNKKNHDYPCFLYQHNGSQEMLWGVTYRIITAFLELIFQFTPPPLETLPVIRGKLKGSYMNSQN